MLQALDGPSKQYSLTVDNTVIVEVKKTAEDSLDERKVVTIQAEGKIRIFFSDGISVPLLADVLDNGLIHFKWAKETYEASTSQVMYIAGETATPVKVYIVERA